MSLLHYFERKIAFPDLLQNKTKQIGHSHWKHWRKYVCVVVCLPYLTEAAFTQPREEERYVSVSKSL